MKTIYLNVKCISFLKALCNGSDETNTVSLESKKTKNIVKEEFDFLGWDVKATETDVIARKGVIDAEKIVVTTHIEPKNNAPCSLDNASGTVVMLLLADLLSDYTGGKYIEMAALNGSDYIAVKGKTDDKKSDKDSFASIILNINVDGPGYKIGETTFSFFNFSEEMYKKALKVLKEYSGIIEGPQWVNGDHSVFVQAGKPAIAITSNWLLSNSKQDITRSEKDSISMVDSAKLVEISQALNSLIRSM